MPGKKRSLRRTKRSSPPKQPLRSATAGVRRKLLLGVVPATFVALAIAAFVLYQGQGPEGSPDQLSSSAGSGSRQALRVAPTFALPAVDGRTVSLADFRNDRNVLLFFNEGVG